MNWYTRDGFKKLTKEEEDTLSNEQLKSYLSDLKEEEAKTQVEGLEALKAENKAVMDKLSNVEKVINDQSELIDELKARGVDEKSETFENALKTQFDKSLNSIKSMGSGSLVDLVVNKGIQDYGDIDSGLDFAQMRPGVTDIPVRQPRFRSLFATIPVRTEFYKYTEQKTVVRDAQMAGKCEAVSTGTKQELEVSSIETTKVKDMIEFCIQFVSDYSFMQSRIRKLLLDSVSLKVDQQILLGDPVANTNDTFSINSVSSEFTASNPVCDIALKIQDGSFVDLILGMQTQIDVIGEEVFYSADTVIVNKCDWFVGVESRKDANNNYLDDRVTYVGGVPFIAGMRVMTSPLVPANTCYVFDSSKGEILQREGLNVSISYENRDAWEKEIGYIKAYECLNFLVINNNKNAFMKCSDIQTAIVAITTP